MFAVAEHRYQFESDSNIVQVFGAIFCQALQTK